MPAHGWLLALLTVGPLTALMQDAGRSAAGLWLSEARSDGGLGGWVQVRDDGTASLGFGAVIEGKYTGEKRNRRRIFECAMRGGYLKFSTRTMSLPA
jgi:hypothetical protein